MTQHQEEFSHLVALTKLYINQEHDRHDWIMTDPEAYSYYKTFAQSQRSTSPAKPPPPTKKVAPMPPPLAAKPAPPPPKETTKPQEEKPAPATEAKPRFSLAPMDPTPADDFSDIKKMLSGKMPSQAIQDPPDDATARQVRNQWKNREQALEVIVADVSQSPQQRALLQNLTAAIDLCLGPAKLLPPESLKTLPPSLKLLVGKEATIPFLKFEDLQSLLQAPTQKAALWKKICQLCQSTKNMSQ